MLLPEKLSSVPQALKSRPYWVLWKLVTRGDKTTKIPYQISGAPAESNDPATWAEYKDVLAAWKKTKQYAGIGCMIRDPFIAVDFDHCRDPKTGVIEPWALNAIHQLGSYTEVSPSGEGLHVWCLGTIPGGKGKRKGRVEIYCNVRYFTVTGEHVPTSPLTLSEIPQSFVTSVDSLDPLHKEKPEPEAARQNRPANVFEKLMVGDWQALKIGDGTHSAADLHLCTLLAEKFNGNADIMDRVFRSSGMMRPKWDEKHGQQTYGEMTIALTLAEWKQSAVRKARVTIPIMKDENSVMEVTEWLVPQFIPSCEPTLFTGDMDTRKTTLALDTAAALSSKRAWFNGAENIHEPMATLVVADEDKFTSTIMPRYYAAGGARGFLRFIPLEVKVEEFTKDGMIEYGTALSFDDHLGALAESVLALNAEGPRIGLLICDPLITHFGDKRYTNAQEARIVINKLKKFLEEIKLSNINIGHFNKTQGVNAKQKTGGSSAIPEAHRQVWSFQLDEKKENTLILPVKKNLLEKAVGHVITTVSTPVAWDVEGKPFTDQKGVVKHLRTTAADVDDVIAEKESPDRGSRRELRAAIRKELASGRRKAGEVKHNLVLQEFKPRTIERAVEKMVEDGELRRIKEGFAEMFWELVADQY